MGSVTDYARSVVQNRPLTPDELQIHISGTYFVLRRGIVVAALLLPLVLYVAGTFVAHPELPDPLPSISHYYAYGNGFTRDWFVGTLCAVGVFLLLYKGFSKVENLVLNIAGVLAVIVAFVPCRCGDVTKAATIHGAAAIAFFACIAFVCVRCGPDTLSLINDEHLERRFKRRYHLIGVAMVVFPLAAWGVSLVFGLSDRYQFVAELFGIYTFAAYWLAKSKELALTQAERLALQGKAEKKPGGRIVRAA